MPTTSNGGGGPECSICLSAFKDPVSILCGHVYCTKCLADHVNAPDNDGLTSFCPTCRTVFNIVTPDLTYLPKKYHQYVVPAVRRVYLDSSANSDLKKKLSKAEIRIKKLEKEQELLLKQCEQYMAAAKAHAAGEKEAIEKVENLDESLADSRAEVSELAEQLESSEFDREQLSSKYQKLKRQFRDLNNQFNDLQDQPRSQSKPENSFCDAPVYHDEVSSRPREIRPLPRKTRSMGRPPPPRPKRPRLSAPAHLHHELEPE